MILKALYDHAVEENLIGRMEIKDRLVHLLLQVNDDGTVPELNPWETVTREVTNPKTGAVKPEVGRALPMPEFPGAPNGGKAYFLADPSERLLGIFGKTGDPVPDDPTVRPNATKAFRHFWQRIADAHAATGQPELATLLRFHARYLATEEARRQLPFAGMIPPSEDAKPAFCALGTKPVPLDGRTISFTLGTYGTLVFEPDSPLHGYWRTTFLKERFDEAPEGNAAGPSEKTGFCLVTMRNNQPIAESHKTTIKGIPGLPPLGGYLVSFDKSSPAFTSFGFQSGWNAPVSEEAAAAYALALNKLLADAYCARKLGNQVMVSWIGGHPEVTKHVQDLMHDPQSLTTVDAPIEKAEPTSQDEFNHLFEEFAKEGKFYESLKAGRFRSVTLAANGGRVVVRRWLDEPLGAVVESLRRWFDDLETIPIGVPVKAGKARETSAGPLAPLSIYALAATTARVPSEVADGVYDALYRAALGTAPGEIFNPVALLAPLLQRIRILAADSGNGLRFRTSHFALLKLILIRSGGNPMPIEPKLCVTDDPAYNCGRLLAVLDSLQYAAQGQVGAGVVSRYYGGASTYPVNVLPALLRLSVHHVAKLMKPGGNPAAGFALQSRLREVLGLFPSASPDGPPCFPELLSPREQGRFALGFHQQKGHDDRAWKAAKLAKAQGKPLDTAADADAAIAEVLDAAAAIND